MSGTLVNPLRARRMRAALTQADLAAACGVSIYTVQRWESWSPQGPRDWQTLGRVLRVDPAQLEREYRDWQRRVLAASLRHALRRSESEQE